MTCANQRKLALITDSENDLKVFRIKYLLESSN